MESPIDDAQKKSRLVHIRSIVANIEKEFNVKVVPCDPTLTQHTAGYDQYQNGAGDMVNATYKSMVDAAPSMEDLIK